MLNDTFCDFQTPCPVLYVYVLSLFFLFFFKVSLRDVERTLKVLNWFLQKEEIVNRVTRELPQYVGHEFLVSLVLSLGVTFYSRLEDRQAYLQQITPNLKLDTAAFELIVTTCQRIFICW